MWYLTIHRWTGPSADARGLLGEHLRWNERQHASGRVLFSGPSEDGRLGIIVFRGGDLGAADVAALCRQEPFVKAGLREFEVIPWIARQVLGAGAFTVEELALATAQPGGPVSAD